MTSKEDILLCRLLEVLDDLVDSRVGIISQLEERPPEPGDPAFYHVYTCAANVSRLVTYENFRHCGGASTVLEHAVAKGVGEAVERYCSAIYESSDLPLTSADSAPFECIDPSVLELYRPQDYALPDFYWAPFLSSTPVRWAPCTDVLGGKEVHVPASMVHIPYYYHPSQYDPPILQPISTGLACHMGVFHAACAGVLEVLERDAVTISWQAELSLPHIIPETLSPANFDALERLERAGFKVTILNATMDHGIPTVLSVLETDMVTQPAVVVAGSANLDPERAVRASLEELAHTRRYSHMVKSYNPLKDPGPGYCHVKDQAAHLAFWAEHVHREKIGFLLRSEDRIEFEELPNLDLGHAGENLMVLCRSMDSLGYRVLLADLTTPEVRDLGLAVVRAVVPGMHPLFLGHSHRATGGTRLWEVPGRIGLRGRKPEDGDNPLPHPYP